MTTNMKITALQVPKPIRMQIETWHSSLTISKLHVASRLLAYLQVCKAADQSATNTTMPQQTKHLLQDYALLWEAVLGPRTW